MDLLQPDINLLYADLLRMATIPALSAKGFSVRRLHQEQGNNKLQRRCSYGTGRQDLSLP